MITPGFHLEGVFRGVPLTGGVALSLNFAGQPDQDENPIWTTHFLQRPCTRALTRGKTLRGGISDVILPVQPGHDPRLRNLDGVPVANLNGPVIELVGKMPELERTVAARRDEVVYLCGLKRRPTIHGAIWRRWVSPQRRWGHLVAGQ